MGARRSDRLLRTIAAATFFFSAVGVGSKDAEDLATVHLRDGSKVQGRIEALTTGLLVLRVWPDHLRRFPLADVALIDRQHGVSGLPEAERREARGAAHLLLFVTGSSIRGRLLGIKQSEGFGEDRSDTYIFRTFDGQERRFQQSEIARVYLDSRPFEVRAKAAPVVSMARRTIPSGARTPPLSEARVSIGSDASSGEAPGRR